MSAPESNYRSWLTTKIVRNRADLLNATSARLPLRGPLSSAILLVYPIWPLLESP